MSEKAAVYRTRRRASRVDGNQGDIERALSAAGYKVVDTSSLGSGYPDLVAVDKTGRTYLIEVKRDDGNEKFTKKEVDFMVHMVVDSYRVICQPEQVGEYLIREF